MQKILFNDKFGLTQAVLGGRKTMTRRIIPELVVGSMFDFSEFGIDDKGRVYIWERVRGIDLYPKYQIGEVVAVAQAYKDAGYPNTTIQTGKCVRKGNDDDFVEDLCLGQEGDWFIDQLAGWENKMFVHAVMMPHRIRITNVRVERLQDISDEDCLREGVCRKIDAHKNPTQFCGFKGTQKLWFSPRDAFAALIDKVSGKGTWVSNPWVWVYEFELVK